MSWKEDPDGYEFDDDVAADTPIVLQPTDCDVVMGRGKANDVRPGNVKFRQVVASFREVYQQAATNEKRNIAERVMNQVIEHGGRFLRPGIHQTEGDDDTVECFYIASMTMAINKTSQALREKNGATVATASTATISTSAAAATSPSSTSTHRRNGKVGSPRKAKKRPTHPLQKPSYQTTASSRRHRRRHGHHPDSARIVTAHTSLRDTVAAAMTGGAGSATGVTTSTWPGVNVNTSAPTATSHVTGATTTLDNVLLLSPPISPPLYSDHADAAAAAPWLSPPRGAEAATLGLEEASAASNDAGVVDSTPRGAQGNAMNRLDSPLLSSPPLVPHLNATIASNNASLFGATLDSALSPTTTPGPLEPRRFAPDPALSPLTWVAAAAAAGPNDDGLWLSPLAATGAMATRRMPTAFLQPRSRSTSIFGMEAPEASEATTTAAAMGTTASSMAVLGTSAPPAGAMPPPERRDGVATSHDHVYQSDVVAPTGSSSTPSPPVTTAATRFEAVLAVQPFENGRLFSPLSSAGAPVLPHLPSVAATNRSGALFRTVESGGGTTWPLSYAARQAFTSPIRQGLSERTTVAAATAPLSFPLATLTPFSNASTTFVDHPVTAYPFLPPPSPPGQDPIVVATVAAVAAATATGTNEAVAMAANTGTPEAMTATARDSAAAATGTAANENAVAGNEATVATAAIANAVVTPRVGAENEPSTGVGRRSLFHAPSWSATSLDDVAWHLLHPLRDDPLPLSPLRFLPNRWSMPSNGGGYYGNHGEDGTGDDDFDPMDAWDEVVRRTVGTKEPWD